MHDEQLEAYLRDMSPAPLPPALRSRLSALPISTARRETPAKVRWLSLVGPPFALAALFFLVVLLDGFSTPQSTPSLSSLVASHSLPRAQVRTPTEPPPADYQVFQSVTQRSTLVNLSPGILVEAGPNRPLRLMKAKWLDDVTYVGDNHATLHRQTTRTEFIVVNFNPL